MKKWCNNTKDNMQEHQVMNDAIALNGFKGRRQKMKLNRIVFLVFSDIVTHSPTDSVREAKTRTKIFGAI